MGAQRTATGGAGVVSQHARRGDVQRLAEEDGVAVVHRRHQRNSDVELPAVARSRPVGHLHLNRPVPELIDRGRPGELVPGQRHPGRAGEEREGERVARVRVGRRQRLRVGRPDGRHVIRQGSQDRRVVVVHHRHLERLLRAPPSPVLHRYADRLGSAELALGGGEAEDARRRNPGARGSAHQPVRQHGQRVRGMAREPQAQRRVRRDRLVSDRVERHHRHLVGLGINRNLNIITG